MGYTTDFEGEFQLDKPLTEAQAQYLTKFSETRRMGRTIQVENLSDPVRKAVGLPVGPEGAYFVGGNDCVIDYNEPPQGQPGLWCQWVPQADEDGAYTAISWDGGEKFYEYVEWLEYIIVNFLEPWGYKLNGTVEWFGEESNDRGLIVVEDNAVTTKVARVVYD